MAIAAMPSPRPVSPSPSVVVALTVPLNKMVGRTFVPDEDMGEQIKAVVEPLPGGAGDAALRASIMEHVRARLGKYKWPRSIDFMDALPREPTGKLLKRTLRDPYWEGRDRAI